MDEELVKEIHETGRRLGWLSRFQSGHTPVQGEQALMFYLSEHKRAKAGDAAKFRELGTGRIANLAKLREKKGLVYREKDKEDGRVTYLSLTKEGERKSELIKQKTNAFLEERQKRWTKEKAKRYLKMTNEWIDVFKERRSKDV